MSKVIEQRNKMCLNSFTIRQLDPIPSKNLLNFVVLSEHLNLDILHEVFLHKEVSIRTLKKFRNVNRQWNQAGCRVLKTRAGSLRFQNNRQVDYFLSEFPKSSDHFQVTRFSINLAALGFDYVKHIFNHIGECDVAKISLLATWSSFFTPPSIDTADTLTYCLNKISNVRHLQLVLGNVHELSSASSRFEFPNLHRLEFKFYNFNNRVYSEDAVLIKIIEASPQLNEFVLELGTPSFLTEDGPPQKQSSLRQLPEALSKLGKSTKVFLSLELTLHSLQWDTDRNTRLVRWKTFFEQVVIQLMPISWTAFELNFDKQFAKESGPLIRKHAPTLRKLRTTLDPCWTGLNAQPFQKCRVLELIITNHPPSETLFQLFPNVQEFVIDGRKSMIQLFQFASNLPILTKLVLRKATWKSFTKQPIKTVAEISAIAKSKEVGRPDQPLLSNPLSQIAGLKTLVLDSSCEDSAFDWVLYNSALGELKRLKFNYTHWVNTGFLRSYTELINRFHDVI